MKSAIGYMTLSIGVAIGPPVLLVGCGGSQVESSAAYNPAEHKGQMDSMRAFMEKQKSGTKGQPKKASH
jgi:hypothetical protein